MQMGCVEKIYIKYKEGILDPQGKTVHNALESMEIKNISCVSANLSVSILQTTMLGWTFAFGDEKKFSNITEIIES